MEVGDTAELERIALVSRIAIQLRKVIKRRMKTKE
jgi:hypothetical protein